MSSNASQSALNYLFMCSIVCMSFDRTTYHLWHEVFDSDLLHVSHIYFRVNLKQPSQDNLGSVGKAKDDSRSGS